MDARLEAALLDVLERTSGGASPDDAWLRAAHPLHWREIRAILDFQARVAGGARGGARVGPYRLLQRLGRGGAGTVYLAQTPDGRDVAVKVLHPHLVARPGFVERAIAEARVAAAIEHPNVVRTLDAGVDGAAPQGREAYIVTEYVEGQNLRGLLDDLGPLPEALVRHLAAEVLHALAAIHAAGAVHGDLKPENVLVGPDESVRVVDLGLGVVTSPTSPEGATGFHGTALYAAPERFPGSGAAADGRADLYSLGVMVEELLAGVHPLTPQRTARAAVTPSAFLRAFATALRSPRREDRFGSAEEALAVLAAGHASAWWRTRSGGAPAELPRTAWTDPCAGVTSLHGRSQETARLRALLAEVAGGTARDALVTGEAGMGKTRFLAEFAAMAHAEGALVVWCSHDAGCASDALAAALRASHTTYGFDLALHASAAEGLASALVAWISGRLAPDGAAPLPGAARSVATGALLRSLARDRPVLVVADDFHLAAEEDRGLAGALVTQLRDDRVLFVASSRPAGADACRRALPKAAAIELDGLRVQEVDALLAEALASDCVAGRLAPEVHQRTAGIPLAVLEQIDALRTAGVLVRAEDGTWTLRESEGAPSEPASARTLLARRIAALPVADRALLEVAACCGPRFDPVIVARALGRDVGRVLLRLARLERRSRLVRVAADDATFEHHEVRGAVLDALPQDVAHVRHAALGTALAADCSDRRGATPRESIDIARHFLAAGDGPRAAPHIGPALEWLDVHDRATEGIEFCGAALSTPGAAGPEIRPRVLMVRGAAFLLTNRYDEAVLALDAAAEAARARSDGSLARAAANLAAQCFAQQGRVEEALARARAIVADAAASGDAVGEERAQGAIAGVLLNLGRCEEGARHAERRFALSRSCGDPIREGEGETGLAVTRMLTARWDEALTLFASGIPKLRGTQAHAGPAVPALTNYGLTLERLGRREEAVAAYSESARLARGLGNAYEEANARSYLASQLRGIGRYEEARFHLDRALELVAGSGNPVLETGVLRYLGNHVDAEGRSADGLAAYERSAAIAQEVGYPLGVVFAKRAAANVLGRLGDLERAGAHAAASAAAANGIGSEFALVVAGWAVARWTPPDRQPDVVALRRAESRLRELARDEAAVELLVDLGRLERSRGRTAEAEADMTRARETALRLDHRDLVLVCDVHLAALGRGDATDVARRLDATWPGHSLWTRIEAAGLVAHAGGAPALLDRARRDVESAVAWAPPECRATLRARLGVQIEGAID